MDIINKIDLILINESSYGLYGKEKSKFWKNFRDKILNAKNKKEVQEIMKKITEIYKSKKISLSEFKDLVDKIDMKIVKLTT